MSEVGIPIYGQIMPYPVGTVIKRAPFPFPVAARAGLAGESPQQQEVIAAEADS